jgi:hypothetical protein
MIYQSFSGDAEVGVAKFVMNGGSIEAATGPLFYINNTKAAVKLAGAKLTAASGILIKAAGGRWGTPGRNGGNLILSAERQVLTGNIELDNISSIAATLQSNAMLTGSINAANTAKEMNLTLDASSKWNVTADSYLTSLNLSDGISGATIPNIIGNGHTVYYDSKASSPLGGRTYALMNGGNLKPK